MIKFFVDWLDAPGVEHPVLARTWCRLTIRINDQTVTRVHDRRTKGWRDGVFGSVFPLCAWVVENFWFLQYEAYRWRALYGSRDLAQNPSDRVWVQRHSLLSAREGGALPDLTFSRDGDSIAAHWLKDGGDASHPNVKFVREGSARLDPEQVRQSFGSFVGEVLDRVSNIEEREVAQLRDDWVELQNLTQEERDIFIWSARLGINAHYDDELSDSDERSLQDAVHALDRSLVDDFLDAASIDQIREDVDWVVEARNRTQGVRLWNAGKGKSDLPNVNKKGTAYETGYAHATTLRENVKVSDAIGNLGDLMRRIGWADVPMIDTGKQPATTSLRAVVDHVRDNTPVVAAYGESQDEPDGRFLLARSLFMENSARTGCRLVTNSHSWDQRASRAFAAEFLAPASALSKRISRESVTEREVDHLAEEFGVGSQLVQRQIENHALAKLDRSSATVIPW